MPPRPTPAKGPAGPLGPAAPVPLSTRVLAPVAPVAPLPEVGVPRLIEPPTLNSSLVRIDSATETSMVVSVNW